MQRRIQLAISFLLFCGFALAPNAFAQSATVTGTVSDAETGETIPGANVQLLELQRGAATNAQGGYSIGNVPAGEYTLRVTFVGYEPFEATVGVEAGETVTQDAELRTGAVGLDEIVVTGYTTQRRENVTGSITSIRSGEIEDIPVQNTEALLQGRAAGVTLSATSGNPGAGFEVNIRGQSSINAGNRPLYIVDGVQMSFNQESELNDRSPMNAINPKDIESIEVLKDAAAASIYGSQAATGVVLITTKSGSEGDTRVSLRYEGGVRFQSERFDLMDRDEWLDFQIDAFGEEEVREDILPAFGYEPDTPFNQLADYDWQGFIFDPGASHSVGFTANGGDKNTQFYLSGNWENTDAAVKKVSYEAYNFRSNLSQRFTEDLTLDIRLTMSEQDAPGVCQDGFFINCPFYQSIGEEPPISFPYLPNGDYNPNTEQSSTTNPALVLNEEERDVDVTQIIGNLSPRYRITDWLTFQGTLGIDYQSNEETDYESPVRAPSEGGLINRRFNTVTNLTVNGRLNANRTFADVHDAGLLIGSEYRREEQREDDNTFIGLNNDILKVPDAASENTSFQGFNNEFRLLSYFGQATYTYDDRYVLTLTSRVDGTSRFGEDRRFAFFPAASVAWRVAQEDFFNVDAVEELKLRAGYGTTGNSNFTSDNAALGGNYPSRGLYDVSGNYDGQVGIRPEQLANPLLTWEEKEEVNLAVDYSLWRGRVSGSIDVYRSNTDRLLLNRPLPQTSGYDEIAENVGSIRNQGIEFDVRTVNLQRENFIWTSRFNIAVNQNTVTELTQGLDALDEGGTLPTAVGHSIEAWSVPIWAGVNPADGRPMWYDADGNITYNPDNADDQFFDGGEEDVVGGFGTRVTYGGVSLDLFFDYSYGATALPNTQRTWSAAFGEGVLGFLADDRWRNPGDLAEYPRATPFGSFDNAEDPDAITSLWLYSANYVRLRNATLSYRFPDSLLDAVRLRGARVYVTGVNLLTWSSYLGIDPEVEGAFEDSSYPAEQQLNFGVQLDL